MDWVTYKNQLELCEMTGGLTPHPAVQPMKSPSGLPLTSPWQVAAVGQRVETNEPKFYPMPVAPAATAATYVSARKWDETFPVVSYPSAPYYEPVREGPLRRLVNWIVNHIFPFYLLHAMGKKLRKAPGILRAVLAVFCGCLVVLALSHQRSAWEPISPRFTLGWGWLVGAVASVLGGWKLHWLLGGFVLFMTRLLAFLAVVIAVCGFVGGLIYFGIVLFAR